MLSLDVQLDQDSGDEGFESQYERQPEIPAEIGVKEKPNDA